MTRESDFYLWFDDLFRPDINFAFNWTTNDVFNGSVGSIWNVIGFAIIWLRPIVGFPMLNLCLAWVCRCDFGIVPCMRKVFKCVLSYNSVWSSRGDPVKMRNPSGCAERPELWEVPYALSRSDYNFRREFCLISDYNFRRELCLISDYNFRREFCLISDYNFRREFCLISDYNFRREFCLVSDYNFRREFCLISTITSDGNSA